MIGTRILIILAMCLLLLPVKAYAVPPPFFGRADIHIDLRQPNGSSISLDDNTYDRMISDLRKLPALFEEEIMPNLRVVLLEHQDQLLGRFVHYISVQYDMDGIMRIEVAGQPDTFPDQMIDIDQNISESIDVLRYVQVSMNLNVNFTTLEMIGSVLDRTYEYNSARVQILSNHAIESLVINRGKLQHSTPSGERADPDSDNTGAVIGLIVVKMLDNDLARMTVFYPTNQEGRQLIALDEVKTNVLNSVPEFPVSGIVISAALSVVITVTLIMKRGGGLKTCK